MDVSEVARVLSLIPEKTWPQFVQHEPEWIFMPAGWSSGLFLNLMVACGLNDYQLKGRAETAYWPPLVRLVQSASKPRSSADLARILEPFYATERLHQAKVARLNRYLASPLANRVALLSAKEVAEGLGEYRDDLAVTMRQHKDAKTIAFAMKCMSIGLQIQGIHALPNLNLAIPVDSRVRGLAQRIGLVGKKSSDAEIRACWLNVLQRLRGSVPSVTIVDLDSLLWQGARWNSGQKTSQWLTYEYGVSCQVAQEVGELFDPRTMCQPISEQQSPRRYHDGTVKKEEGRIMLVPFPKRSEFEKPLRSCISDQMTVLKSGREIRCQLKPGGYQGSYTLVTRSDMHDGLEVECFGSNAEHPDYFPQRIRVAAWALHLEGCQGRFRVSHYAGVVTIAKLSDQSCSPCVRH